MAIQIGKYKRPGIFIEEIDRSIVTSPTQELGLPNLVIGVSRKGPVNTPIEIKNISELESIFGSIDRQLEKKGSFFHRTVAKMLESTSVYAVNLLITDDNLDTVDYQSLSGSVQYNNDSKRIAPYRRFFDTTGFWKKSTDEFISVTMDNSGYENRVLNFTNLGDRYISVFCFKSKRSGFDRPMLEWYGSVEKMPPYVYPTDYASDYLVDVLVVGGDWSNAENLANDPRWNRYFSVDGLIKERVREFTSDRNVSVLAFYEGLSMIPYFRDLDGKNIFIENVINRDTDKTGLFCAFNDDVFETNYPTGLVDLIGNSLVGDDLASNPPTIDETFYQSLDQNDGVVDGNIGINFLSYQETLTETLAFVNVSLDKPGNVVGLFQANPTFLHNFNDGSVTGGVVASGEEKVYQSERTYWFAEGYVNDLVQGTVTASTTSISIAYTAATNSYAVVGGNLVEIEAGSYTADILATYYANTSATASYNYVVVVDSALGVKVIQTKTVGVYPSVATTDIVLGYGTVQLLSGLIVTAGSSFTPLTVNGSGYVHLVQGTDYGIATSSTVEGAITVTFSGTNVTPNVTQYAIYRRFKAFNNILSYINTSSSYKGVMLLNPDTTTDKLSLVDVTVSDIITQTSAIKSFTINTGLTYAELADVTDSPFKLIFYKLDDEFIIGAAGFETKAEIADLTATTGIGVVAKYSNFYTKYYDGRLSMGDLFYQNTIYGAATVSFYEGATLTASLEGYNYLVIQTDDATDQVFLDALDFDYQFLIGGGVYNNGVYTFIEDVGMDSADNPGWTASTPSSPSARATALGFSASYYAFEVSQTVVDESYGVLKIFSYSGTDDGPIYLQMYIDSTDNLIVSFKDYKLVTTGTGDDLSIFEMDLNNTLFINSKKGDLKQSIEVETPSGWESVPNKILVKKNRYGSIKLGDFLEAQYDATLLQADEMPKKLTRITSKKLWSIDTNYVEISCDAPIKLYDFDGDLQTIRRTQIDEYVSAYKAISLKGFRVRNASLPDGTDSRLSEILDVVASGTALFGALTNKDAFDFRYLVDSFGLGLTEDSKQNLVDICGYRLDCFGILNMPSLRQFKQSVSPNFKDATGVLSMEYVAKGGDPESNPEFLYSFGKGPGVTAVGYFLPYVMVNDYGRVIEIPPASYVATAFMRKFNQSLSSITPWTVVAGVNNGRILGIEDIEQIFAPTDLEHLNQAQMNPLTFKRNRGFIIETDNTAQVLVKSSLSEIHVREALIELERELATMLLDFQWKTNTPEVRSSIKLAADVICEKYLSQGALFNYFNKIDEENNPLEIVDAGIGVLDTYVEPIKAMGIIVNNITILRTGAIQAGGFIIS